MAAEEPPGSAGSAPSTPQDEPQSFRFINTQAPGLDEQSQKDIRRQAMRDYHRRKKHGEPGTGSSRAADVDTPPPLQVQKHKIGPAGWRPAKASVRRRPLPLVELALPAQLPITRAMPIPDRAVIDSYVRELEDTVLNEWLADEEVGIAAGAGAGAVAAVSQSLVSPRLANRAAGNQTLRNLGKEPFNALPIPNSRRVEQLLHVYWNCLHDCSWLMFKWRKEWFARAIHDPAVFCASMAHYAEFDKQKQKIETPEPVIFRTRAIQLVGTRLSTAEGTSDGTITAVAILLASETAYGSTETVLHHLNGLEKLIARRGGIEQAGFPSDIYRLILWADLGAACALWKAPRFLTATMASDLPEAEQNVDYEADLVESFSSLSCSDDLSISLSRLRCLHEVFQDDPVGDEEKRNNEWYGDEIWRVRRDLLLTAISTDKPQDHLNSAFAVAALIFLDVAIREIRMTATLVTQSMLRLKSEIEKSRDSLTAVLNDAVRAKKPLWALIIGGLVANGRPERAWFIDRLLPVSEKLSLSSCTQLEELLRSILWDEHWKARLSLLWFDMEKARAARAARTV